MKLIHKNNIPVLKMTCAACASGIGQMLQSTPGVLEADINFATKTLNLQFDSEKIELSQIQKAIQQIGYDIIIEDDEERSLEQAEVQNQRDYRRLRRNTIGAWVLGIPLMVLAMFFMHLPYLHWILLALTIPIIFVFGQSFFVNAQKQIKSGRLGMDTLVAVSTGIAFLFSLFTTLFPQFWTSKGLDAHVYYEAAGVVIAFVLLGKWMEIRAQQNSSSAIMKLMGLQPKTARRLRKDGTEEEVPISAILYGDHILIRPGEQIPIDGEVMDGLSYIDESMISGEPMPVEKQCGQKVFAGTMNQRGALTINAQKVGKETFLAQMVQKVRQAQGSRAPVQRTVDKISAIFVPAVIILALLTFSLWMLIGGKAHLSHALLSTISVLVIACPCALGLATPMAVMVGIGKGAEYHILIKDAVALEKLRQINTIVLDKTGTITQGNPEVLEWEWLSSTPEKHKQILLGAELKSEHPLAKSITEALLRQDIKPAYPDYFENHPGQGIRFEHKGKHYKAGKLDYLGLTAEQIALARNHHTDIAKWEQMGTTTIYFGDQDRLIAFISIADPIKTGSAEAIRQLQEQKIEVHMLTGDNAQTARTIAETVGILHFKSNLLPDDKEQYVRELQCRDLNVAMVGDGINDAQALASADVSVAMGRGSDIAMEVAMVTLVSSELSLLPKAIKLSQQTIRLIRQNLFWAFIYNLLMIPIAAGLLYPVNNLLMNPMWAGAAMAFSSVSVVLNSLRLKRRQI